MEQQYLIDTNTVSDFFSAAPPNDGLRLMEKIVDNVPNISVITQVELLSWVTDANIEQMIEEFIADSFILDISPMVVQYLCSNS